MIREKAFVAESKRPALLARTREGAAGNDVMRHVLACALAAGLAGGARHQAEGLHFAGPFPVMVVPADRLPEVLLPVVRHLVNEYRKHFPVGPAHESLRIETDLADALHHRGVRPWVPAEKPFGVITTPVAVTRRLKRHQSGGKLPGKEGPVEELKRGPNCQALPLQPASAAGRTHRLIPRGVPSPS